MKKDYVAIEIDFYSIKRNGVLLTSTVGEFKLDWLDDGELGGEE